MPVPSLAEARITSSRGMASVFLELSHHHLRVSTRKVDLVDDRDDHQVLGEREVHVGQGLRLDALARIDHQDRPLARLQ